MTEQQQLIEARDERDAALKELSEIKAMMFGKYIISKTPLNQFNGHTDGCGYCAHERRAMSQKECLRGESMGFSGCGEHVDEITDERDELKAKIAGVS